MSTNRNFKQLDDNFEHFLDNVLVDVVETDLTEEKRAARRARADKDDLEFCKIYYPNIFNLDWNDLHLHIAACRAGMYTISGFRKCGKSAFTYVGKVIKALAMGVGGIVNINARTQEISTERTSALKRLMMRNQMLTFDYDIELQQDLKGFYIINNTYLVAGSVRTGLRNLIDDDFKRIRLAVNDDLYNKDTVTSEWDNAKVVDFVESEVRGQLEDDGLAITMGNSISEDCPIMQLKEKHTDNHFSLPALNANGESNWPEYRSADDWMQARKDIPYDVWLGEYMDKPGLKGDIFDVDWLKTINISNLKILAALSACDPSYGQSPGACSKAIATVGITQKREVVCLDLYIRKESYFQLFDYVSMLAEKTPLWKVLLFENDFNQWAFADPYYRDWVNKRGKTLPIVQNLASQLQTQYRSADKDSRIINLVHPHQTGGILYDETITGSHDFEVYKSQYLAYGKSKTKLDGLDAMATAYIMIFRYLESGRFKQIKKRVFGGQSWFRKA